MGKIPIVIKSGDKAPEQEYVLRESNAGHPPSEDELGGGDICAVEETPSTEDDKPLD